MSDDLKLFSSPELKDTVQDMRDLLSQSRLAFLLGAGCSLKAGLPLMPKLTEEVLGHDKIGEKTNELLNEVRKLFSGAVYDEFLGSDQVNFLILLIMRLKTRHYLVVYRPFCG